MRIVAIILVSANILWSCLHGPIKKQVLQAHLRMYKVSITWCRRCIRPNLLTKKVYSFSGRRDERKTWWTDRHEVTLETTASFGIKKQTLRVLPCYRKNVSKCVKQSERYQTKPQHNCALKKMKWMYSLSSVFNLLGRKYYYQNW